MEVTVTCSLVLCDALLTGTVLKWSQETSAGDDMNYVAFDILVKYFEQPLRSYCDKLLSKTKKTEAIHVCLLYTFRSH